MFQEKVISAAQGWRKKEAEKRWPVLTGFARMNLLLSSKLKHTGFEIYFLMALVRVTYNICTQLFFLILFVECFLI
jgi:hypothetical protein